MTASNTHENNVETNPQFLLEIGTEEIPARFLPEAIEKLRVNAEKLFSEHAVDVKSIRTYATPRRLSLIAGLSTTQHALEKEVWGPPVNVAFDSEGNPTRAAEAFAKTHNVSLGDLTKKQKGKGSYIVAAIKGNAKSTEALLPEILPGLIMSLHFPKSMRWGNGDVRFARPVHWILALFNNKRLSFEIDGIKSIGMTRGHRFLAPAAFEIKDTRTYINLLRNNFVILDLEERTRIITEGAKKLAASVDAVLINDAELLQHVVFLVEYPTPVLGTFSEAYLALPKELLTTVMKGHQKYFALENREGKLVNHFIVVSNTKQNNSENVRKGAERVLKARFEDARFYYQEDLKVPLKQRLEGLKKVVYHEKLGTLYDKTVRIASIADHIAAHCVKEKRKDVSTAALLSKADLISGVVREFPELQGVIGSYYAFHEGHDKKISQALAEQYLPVYSGDRLPETSIGSILSLSDKLDNVASFFMLELSPTGSEDPFALRRQALGIIAILLDTRCPLHISSLVDKALQPFKLKHKEPVEDGIIKFFEQRAEALLQANGYTYDAVSAVLHFIKDKPLFTVKERLDALMKFRAEGACDSFLLALKRINNIAPGGDVPAANEALFVQEEEKSLFQETQPRAEKVNALVKGHLYYEALKVLQELTEPINRFFDKVLIMDKNEGIKQNRLSLLKTIQQLAAQIADFSRL
ncbi:MAG TPA: glycine--tRNA ligase subunit beta, partial [Dissulfurispiraceae bacterium]|nr:glycine--tRNA ligase subunit beta [Dissulfurispiraceae bacterium]